MGRSLRGGLYFACDSPGSCGFKLSSCVGIIRLSRAIRLHEVRSSSTIDTSLVCDPPRGLLRSGNPHRRDYFTTALSFSLPLRTPESGFKPTRVDVHELSRGGNGIKSQDRARRGLASSVNFVRRDATWAGLVERYGEKGIHTCQWLSLSRNIPPMLGQGKNLSHEKGALKANTRCTSDLRY